jgi:cytoskeletal protein CcmA (bactofilin family)
MGRNPKDDKSDTTADHTPQQQQPSPASNYSSSGYGSTGSSSASGTGSTGGSPTDSLYQNATHTPTTSRAVTESESLARDIKEGVLSGFVGNGTTLTGEASFKGMLRVDGHLSGRVSSEGGTLIVGNNGQVDANIEVAVAIIQGSVNGDITASQRLEMGRAAKVNGNVQTPSLVIEQGAVFEGSCRMTQQRAAQDKQRAEGSSSGDTLDTSSLEPVSDTSNGGSEISSLSDVAS